jgi:glutaredoxin-like protein
MSLLSPQDQTILKREFSAMTRPVRVLFFSQSIGCETCVPTREILDELPQLSERISIDELNIVLDKATADQYGIDRVPAVVLLGQDEAGAEIDSRIRFLGMPAGYEFVSLVKAIVLVGGGPSELSEESRKRVSSLDAPVTLQVFSTPTCPHCPRAISMAHEMAWASPHVTAFAVEVTEYPDLAQRYRVTGVPKTVVNDKVEILGALPEQEFLDQVLA